jgi:Ca-activated chloride channel family protein
MTSSSCLSSRVALHLWRFTFYVLFVASFAHSAACLAWMNPTRDRIAEANGLFKQGKYEDALAKYGDVLVDNPDSPLLNFNMGDANYKAGKYTEAVASFARVRPGDQDTKRAAKAVYNIGNAEYRLGAATEAEKPQDALKAYAAALVAYRRALGADPTDQDAKFNYEYVTKKIDDLKKKLEEQQKQQDQQKDQQQDQQNDQQQQDQQQQGDQQQDQQQQQQQKQDQQQQAEQKDQQQQQAQQDKDAEQQKQEAQQQQAEQQDAGEQKDQEEKEAAGATAAESSTGEKKDKMSPQEAAALIDTAKNDELRPDEFARQVQRGRVTEPAQDW